MTFEPLVAAGSVLIAGGVAGLGYGLWSPSPGIAISAAGACLVGITVSEVAKRL